MSAFPLDDTRYYMRLNAKGGMNAGACEILLRLEKGYVLEFMAVIFKDMKKHFRNSDDVGGRVRYDNREYTFLINKHSQKTYVMMVKELDLENLEADEAREEGFMAEYQRRRGATARVQV